MYPIPETQPLTNTVHFSYGDHFMATVQVARPKRSTNKWTLPVHVIHQQDYYMVVVIVFNW